jgi:hypothetical protein
MLTANSGSNFTTRVGDIQAYNIGGTTFYRGAVCVIRLSSGTLYMADGTDTTDTLKQIIVGYAMEGYPITSLTTQPTQLRVNKSGQILLKFNGIATGSEGKLACIYDNDTVQLYGVNTCKVIVGRIMDVPDQTHVFVNLQDRPSRLATSLYD